MNQRSATLFAMSALVALVVSAACGGNDDGTPSGTPGPITCTPLEETPYAYTANVVLEVKAPVAPSPGVPPGRSPVRIESTFEAEVEDPTHTQAHVITTDGANVTDYNTRIVGDMIWYDVGGWNGNPRGRDFDPIPYRPLSACAALAPDLDTSKAEGAPEEVSGIATRRYDLAGADPMFFARHRDFGGGSDAGVFITSIEGSAWVADAGGFPAKLDLTGTGEYEDGSQLIVHLSYEVSRWDDGSINVKDPQ